MNQGKKTQQSQNPHLASRLAHHPLAPTTASHRRTHSAPPAWDGSERRKNPETEHFWWITHMESEQLMRAMFFVLLGVLTVSGLCVAFLPQLQWLREAWALL